VRDYGNRFPGCTLYGSFTTVAFATGAPSSLTGNPAPTLVAYKDSQSCSTAGITLARDCNGRTGFNAYSVNLGADATYFSCGHDFELVIHQGTVDGTCVSGYVVGGFSVNNRATLLPQVHGRPVAVTSGGGVNINWAGVENCGNATALTCTSVYTADHLVQRPVIDPCSTTFSVTKLIERPVVDSCSTIFSVQKVIDRPIVDSCSTIYMAMKLGDRPAIDPASVVASVTGSVGSVTGAVGSVTAPVSIDPCSTMYRVETFGSCGVNQILDGAISEPAGVYTFPATLRQVLGYRAALDTNCITQTAVAQSLCTRSVSTTIATYPITCTSTIVHRGTAS
jgi:hypothetical protein